MFLVAPPGSSVTDAPFARALSLMLRYLVDECAARAFNVSVYDTPCKDAALNKVVYKHLVIYKL
eukprot:8121618-Pyramimonas_sp.AAC.1